MPSQIWGGQIVYSEDKFSQLSPIIASFSSNNLDPKAAILPSFTAVLADAISLLIVQIFYDGHSPPPGTFDAFTSVQSISKDLKARTFVDFIEATPAGAVNGLRTYFHPIPVKGYTPKLVKAFADMASVSSYLHKFHTMLDLTVHTLIVYHRNTLSRALCRLVQSSQLPSSPSQQVHLPHQMVSKPSYTTKTTPVSLHSSE